MGWRSRVNPRQGVEGDRHRFTYGGSCGWGQLTMDSGHGF